MEAPSHEDLKQKISDYYKTHLSSGLTCEVKSLSMAEVEETGGKNITATIHFLHSASGESEDNKVVIPCDGKGNLDWTNVKFLDEDDPHKVDPSKPSHPKVKSPQPLPKNNEKPKDGGEPPEGDVKYIQKPEKVGAQGGKKVKAEAKAIRPPKRLGTDELGWPTADQLELEEQQEEKHQQSIREGYIEAEGDDDDLDPVPETVEGGDETFDVFAEAGVSPALIPQAAASRLGESMSRSPEGYVHGQDDQEEDMRGLKPVAINGQDIPVALVEYRAKSKIAGTDSTLFEFGVLFGSEAERDQAKTAVEAMDGVESVELLEDVGIAVVVQATEEGRNPAEPLSVIAESLGTTLVWDEGHKEKFNADLAEATGVGATPNYSDNKGQYHKGIQTDANEPSKPKPSDGADSPGEERGGPKKRKHAKTSGDQGGDGLGGAKKLSTPSVSPDGKESTKSAGQQATESLQEQDFLDDVMSYANKGDANGDETSGDQGGEEGYQGGDEGGEGDEGNGMGVEIDDTIMSLVAAQAEHGIEVVLQVAREKAVAEGTELSPEQEEEIRQTFADYAQDAGAEEDEVEVDAEVTVTGAEDETGDEDDEDEEGEQNGGGGFPFESQTKTEDVNISINDGGHADVTAADPATPVAAAEPSAPVASSETPAAAEVEATEDNATEPSEKPEDEAEESEDDEDKEKEDEVTEEEKPGKEEALTILRDELVNELAEMEEVDALFVVEGLSDDELLRIDEKLPAPGEGGRFKKLKKELGGKGSKDPGALASWIGRKKYGKGKFQKMAAGGKKGEATPAPAPEKKLGEEGADLSGQASVVSGWAAEQPAPNQPLSFVGNDAYSFAQRIAVKDPQVRTAKVLKPGRFSKTTSRHANMVAQRLARHGYQVNRVDAFDNDQGMKVGELDQQLGLGLPEESLIQLSGARFKKEAIEKLTAEQKAQLKEKLIARGAKIVEDQQNQDTYGGTQTIQRVRGKNRNYNMFGRVKPDAKWKGLIRIVWDDGHESWEKPGDVQHVGPNAYSVKSPSGGPTKPGSNKMSKAGGEELDMLKSLESIKKLPREKRFEKAIELQVEGKQLDMDKLVSILTEGWDEFENFDATKLVESVMPKPPAPEVKPTEPVTESKEDEEEGEDTDEIHMLTEDFNGDSQVVTIEDLDESDEQK